MKRVWRWTITGMLFASLGVVIGSRDVVAQACDLPPLATEELREPVAAYLAFWMGIFEAEAESGIPGHTWLYSKDNLPEATKRCEAVVQAAGDRKSLKSSAQTLLKAYAYVSENFMTDKAQRKRPEDADVAALLGDTPKGLTEGALKKCFMIAYLRFQKAVGLEVPITEKQIRERPDIDFSEFGKVDDKPAPKDVTLPEEVVIQIAEDGSIKLNDKAVPLGDLEAALNVLAKRAEKGKRKVLVTLQTEEQAKYERIVQVMDVLGKVGLKNVTFTVGTEEF